MAPVKAELVRFSVDSGKSLFIVQVFAAGIAAVVAHSPRFAVRDFSGELEFVPSTMRDASVRFTISVASLEITDEVSVRDRREIERVMFEEVLELKRYPKIEYKSTSIVPSPTSANMYRVEGDLTLHGVTQPMGFDAQIFANELLVRAQGAFSVMQSHHGLKIASVANGTLKLKDELKCSYFIVGHR